MLRAVVMDDKLFAEQEFVRRLIDAIPALSLVVDKGVCVVAFNTSASRTLQLTGDSLTKLTGDVLACSNALELGCGRTRKCRGCDVRLSIVSALDGKPVIRKQTTMELRVDGEMREVHLLVSATPFLYRNVTEVLLIAEDITEIVTLRQLLPVCRSCGAPRPQDEQMERARQYLAVNPDVTGTWQCPACGDDDRQGKGGRE